MLNERLHATYSPSVSQSLGLHNRMQLILSRNNIIIVITASSRLWRQLGSLQ